MKYYRKISEDYDESPTIKTPSTKDLTDIETDILSFIGTDKKTYDEIEKEILVTKKYSSSKGATGNDIRSILNQLENDGILETTDREDGKFLDSNI